MIPFSKSLRNTQMVQDEFVESFNFSHILWGLLFILLTQTNSSRDFRGPGMAVSQDVDPGVDLWFVRLRIQKVYPVKCSYICPSY